MMTMMFRRASLALACLSTGALTLAACPGVPPLAAVPAPVERDDAPPPVESDGEAWDAFETVVAHRADPNYLVTDQRVASAVDALRGADPTLVARVKAALADKATASSALTRANADEAAASGGDLLDAKLAVRAAQKDYDASDERLTAALNALRDSRRP